MRLRVGKLGLFTFPAGYYVYTGSAMRGLQARLDRHRRRRKKLWWHIDYLLRRARIVEVVEVPTRRRMECALNRRVLEMAGARVVVSGFGASDCRCEAHLAYFGAVRPDVAAS
jgi:sugar fermentation stimulation protein A